MSAKRHLLLGILAFQNNFIDRAQLLAAFNAWVEDKTKALGDLLVAQKAINNDEHALLEALAVKHLDRHGQDSDKSLAALSSAGSARRQLAKIEDPDMQASLLSLSKPQEGMSAGDEADPYTTVSAAERSAGRFVVLRPHAAGGLGQVSVALDKELNRQVALKEIKDKHIGSQEARSRFLLEAEITGGLEHPGIVPVYSLGSYSDGRPFYAMRFIKGDSLKEAIDRFHKPSKAGAEPATAAGSPDFGSLEFRKLLGRFVDVCNAIAYAHSRGVLHRDLKPGNIMLGQYGETLVVDWGLAKAGVRELKAQARESTESLLHPASASGSSETLPGSALGTPAYMSPEQAAGKIDSLGPASDAYSLGATLYHVLTGKAPFEGRAGEVLKKVQAGDFRTPQQMRPSVPRPLEAVCLKAMSLNPVDRYSSARELAEDAERWLADEPVQAWTEPWTVKTRRWTSRHRVLVAAFSAALMVAVVTLTTSTLLLSAAREAERNAKILAQDRESESLANATKAMEKEKTANAALAEVEMLLIENLLRPIGHNRGAPDLIEMEALWKLATLKRSNLRLRVIEKGLADPATAQRLVYRGESAVHAAVGLDADKRQQLIGIALAKLREPAEPPKVREAGVVVALALAHDEEKFVRQAVEVLVSMLTSGPDFHEIIVASEAINALAGKLDKAEARSAAVALVHATHKPTIPDVHERLVPAFAAVSARLEPGDAALLARDIAESMTARIPGTPFRKNSDPATALALARMLSSVAGRLEPANAQAVATPVAQDLVSRISETSQALHLLPGNCTALRTVTAMLSAAERQRAAGQGARIVVGALGNAVNRKPPSNPQAEMQELVPAIETLAGDLGPADVAALSETLSGQIATAPDSIALAYLGKATAAIADRSDTETAGRLAQMLVAQVGKTNSPFALSGLGRAFASAARRLTPAQASQISGAIVSQMKLVAKDAVAANTQATLADTLVLVTSRLQPDHADKNVEQASTILVAQLDKLTDLGQSTRLMRAWLGLAGRRYPMESRQRANHLAEALAISMASETDRNLLYLHGEELPPLLHWLEPEDARKLAGIGIQAIARQMGKPPPPAVQSAADEAERLHNVFTALGARMPRDDVEPLARPAVSYYTKKLDSAVSWLDVQSATSGLIPLAEWFRPQEAAALAWTLVPQLAKQKAPQVVTPLHKACEATVPKMARNDMVDLLKSPLCVGFARTVVLRELGRQAGENFGTVWDFVTWARRHEPDLDLLSPPQAHNG